MKKLFIQFLRDNTISYENSIFKRIYRMYAIIIMDIDPIPFQFFFSQSDSVVNEDIKDEETKIFI